jgi:wobble nucleotide-excising tRNase
MKVTRISKLKDDRLFRDFSWPIDLQAFGRFNLIYGWNGTGKTTSAALFRHLQDQVPRSNRSAFPQGRLRANWLAPGGSR